MINKKRLQDVNRGLSVQEIVHLHIQECRRYPTMQAHATAMIEAGSFSATICSQIEESVKRAEKGQPREVCNRRIREAQRSGMFLWALARECNALVATTARERRLELALLYSGLVLASRAGSDADGLERLTEWGEMAAVSYARLTGLRDGIRLVQDEYFEGTSLLYAGAEAELLEQVRDTENLVERVEDCSKEASRKRNQAPCLAANRHRAGQIAQQLVAVSKYQVLREFDEIGAANRVLDDFLKAEWAGITDTRTDAAPQEREDPVGTTDPSGSSGATRQEHRPQGGRDRGRSVVPSRTRRTTGQPGADRPA
jgi:hypothetical protein